MTDLAILIVNWNVCDYLRACLKSVYCEVEKNPRDVQIWVVDNASRDGSAQMVQAEFDRVRLIVSETNLGFAGGNNLALGQMDEAESPHLVLLLNPDTELRPDSLNCLGRFLDQHASVAMAGPRLRYGDGSFQHSAFAFPGLLQILFDLYPMPDRLHESRLNGRYSRSSYAKGDPFPIDHPLGAAMMVRWEAMRSVGTFDDAYFMYCEEIDWCIRFKRAGWGIYCVPTAEVVHHAGQSTAQVREASFVNLWRSRRRLYQEHYSRAKNLLALRLVRAGLKLRARQARLDHERGVIDRDEAALRIRAYQGALAAYED